MTFFDFAIIFYMLLEAWDAIRDPEAANLELYNTKN